MPEPNQQLADDAMHSGDAPMHTGEPLLDVPRAARYLGMSARWVYRHYAILPHIRSGFGNKPRIKFRRSDLDAWIRQHRIAPSGENLS